MSTHVPIKFAAETAVQISDVSNKKEMETQDLSVRKAEVTMNLRRVNPLKILIYVTVVDV